MLKYKTLLLLIAMTLVLSACGQAALPTMIPSIDPNIVQQTVDAVLTQNAVKEGATKTAEAITTATLAPTSTLLPTSTMIPTFTPIPTATAVPTATRVVVVPPVSVSTTEPKDYYCDILSYSPAEAQVFKPFQDFDGKWEIKNTGTKSWEADSVDVVWSGGTRMSEKTVYDLKETVKSKDTTTIIVDLKAPGYEGGFWNTWKIKRGDTTACVMTLFIVVRK